MYHKIERCDSLCECQRCPLGVGLNFELILMLCMYLVTAGWEAGVMSQLNNLGFACMEER